MAAPTTETQGFRATFKPRDVEELVDFWVNRPLASVLVSAVAPTRITPNQITLMSGLVGLTGGVLIGCASLEHPWQVPLGGFLLFLSILLDCADGQLARLRGKSSMVGRALDGYVDVIPTAAAFIGFAVFLYRSGFDPIYINLVGWTAGYSMKWHTHSYDHAKNIYLNNVLPPEQRGTSLPTMEQIAEEREKYLRDGDWVGALILKGFMNLTKSQRGGWQDGRLGLGLPAAQTEAEREEYRERFLFTMRLWTWNGLASHLVLFLLAAAITPVYRTAILDVWWFILVPMNLLTLFVRASERRVERELQHRFRPRPRDGELTA